MTRLIPLQDADFDWILDDSVPTRAGLRRPPGGLDHPAVLKVIRAMTRRLALAGCKAAWLVVANDEAVGLMSFKAPPTGGQAEIGYGIAASRRREGHATAAVKAIIAEVRTDRALGALTAETAVSNPASGRVLEKNGFVRVGQRNHSDDGLTTLWRLVLPPPKADPPQPTHDGSGHS